MPITVRPRLGTTLQASILVRGPFLIAKTIYIYLQMEYLYKCIYMASLLLLYLARFLRPGRLTISYYIRTQLVAIFNQLNSISPQFPQRIFHSGITLELPPPPFENIFIRLQVGHTFLETLSLLYILLRKEPSIQFKYFQPSLNISNNNASFNFFSSRISEEFISFRLTLDKDGLE